MYYIILFNFFLEIISIIQYDHHVRHIVIW